MLGVCMRSFFLALAMVGAVTGSAYAQARLNAAVVPNLRSTAEGGTVTFFSTVINSGNVDATNCRVVPRDSNSHGTDMDYQRTDAANQPTGTVNTPFAIPAGGSQSLVLAIRPSGPLTTRTFSLSWTCDEAEVQSVFGLSAPRIRLVTSGGDVPDVIMTLVTPSSDGVLRMVDNGRRGVAAGSAINIGDPAPIRFLPLYAVNTGAEIRSSLQLRGASICFTDSQGRCLQPATPFIEDNNFETGEIHTLTVFLDDRAENIIPLFPDILRLEVQAEEITIPFPSGSTSVAVTDDTTHAPIESPPTMSSWRFFATNASTGARSGYSIRITGDGYFYAFPNRRFANERSSYLFGPVDVSMNGNDVVLAGSVNNFDNGTLAGTVDVSGLRLTLGGRLSGGLPEWGLPNVRGFYATGYETPDMSRAFEGIPNFERWEMTVIDGSRLSGISSIRTELFQFSGIVSNNENNVYASCENATVLLTPTLNNEGNTLGTYTASGTFRCAGRLADYDGSYTGIGIVESVADGGACQVLVILENTDNDRLFPVSLRRQDSVGPCSIGTLP